MSLGGLLIAHLGNPELLLSVLIEKLLALCGSSKMVEAGHSSTFNFPSPSSSPASLPAATQARGRNLQPNKEVGMRRWIPLLPIVTLALLTACSPTRSGDALAAAEHLAAAEQTQSPPAACAVTQPPDPPFTPPNPYEAPLQGEFWFGSPALWTSLPLDEAWRDLPHNQGGYAQKVFWWRQVMTGARSQSRP